MSDTVDVHDHPWASFGIILKNGYLEHLGDNEKCVSRDVGDFTCRKAKSFHRIQLLEGTAGDVWTLFGTFKRVRNWGFLVNKNWMPFDEYFASNGTLEAQTLPEQYSGIIFPTRIITCTN
jgi:hypothetical protein